MSKKKKIVWLFKTKRKNRDEYSASTVWLYGILENLGYDFVFSVTNEFNRVNQDVIPRHEILEFEENEFRNFINNLLGDKL